MTRTIAIALLMGCVTFSMAYADNWQPLTGADMLQALVAGSTAEIDLRPGVTAIGKYNADGTAEIEAWNETFFRTWEVKGDDQVCYSDVDTNCYSFEQNLDKPTEFRARNVKTGELVVFRVADAEGRIIPMGPTSDNEGGLGAPDASEIAAALSNPNTNLGSMNFQFDYIAYDGDLPNASSQSALRATFQPSLPYKLSDTTNLFVRPAIPVIIQQDVPNPSGGYDSEGIDLGDMGFDALVAKTIPSLGLVVGGGIVGTVPTATEDSLGLDQWLVGPEVVGAMVRKWGVLGVLVTHQWDVAGEDDYNTSITGGQYFYAFNLQDGWQINGSPVYSYNHKADSDNKLTLPVALGVSKTAIINGRPWKFGVQYWYYVESPDLYGPNWQIRFTISPVVKLPW
ncbi:MAG: hypothetical protein OEU86_09910 [Gammaproteobacteria bacterium]|nr:hypothetical protein [Gammaproteobacteria bacterium]